ncbi:MAG: MaoC family dehydratase [Burkholderiaceae bacterium]|nr:MaoC family dehydratase [Burkholderiaceae bacterium]
MSTQQLTLATLPQWVGKEIGVSDWVTIDQQRIDEFAHCTGDHQWIHVDVERAQRESPFKTTIAHGYLTLSMLANFSFDILIKPLGIAQALNYGSDKVRFLAPVKCGSRIRDHIVLAGAEDKGGGRILVTAEHTVEIEGEDKPALIATALAMIFAG